MNSILACFPPGRLVAVCLLLIGSAAVAGQGVLPPTRTGVIQELAGGGPFQLLISGSIYEYDTDVTEFTLRGGEIEDSDLELGMVVRFAMRDGILLRIEVLGPNHLIENIDAQGILD